MNRSRLITLALASVLSVAGLLATQLTNQTNQAPLESLERSGSGGKAGNSIAEQALPGEAQQTLALIRQGGPFPYSKDGTVFGNREQRLPLKKRGYYREYTVKTPGVSHRGARRIVSGGPKKKPTEHFYTQDHYETFKLIAEDVR